MTIKQHLQHHNVQIVETLAEIKKVKFSNIRPGDLASKFIIILDIIHVTVFTSIGQNTAKSLDIHILLTVCQNMVQVLQPTEALYPNVQMPLLT